MRPWLRLVCAGVLATSCSKGGGEEPLPLPLVGPAYPIMLLGLDLPAAGAALGGHYGGNNSAVRQTVYHMSDGLRARWAQSAREHGEGLLRLAGFRVRAVGAASSDARQLVGVQYGLTGLVHTLTVRTTGQFEPYNVEVSVDIGWELLDLGGGQAVFGRRVQHGARGRGAMDSVVGQAIEGALQKLISEPAFYSAVATHRDDPEADYSLGFMRALPAPSETFVIALADKRPPPDSGAVGRISAGLVTLYGEDKALGTAFVLTRDGLILAAAHEIRTHDRIRARLPSGVDRPVRLVRTSGSLDVALLQLACPGECVTVDWEAPAEVPVFTNVVAVGAPVLENSPVTVSTGRVGGRWGIANGITLEGMGSVVGGGEPVGRTTTGRVFGVVSVRRGRPVVLLLEEVFRSLRVRVDSDPAARTGTGT